MRAFAKLQGEKLIMNKVSDVTKYVSVKDVVPQIGNLGCVLHEETIVYIAVVNHLIKKNVLCFMKVDRHGGLSFVEYEHFYEKWLPVSLDENDVNVCMNWILKDIKTF